MPINYIIAMVVIDKRFDTDAGQSISPELKLLPTLLFRQYAVVALGSVWYFRLEVIVQIVSVVALK
jgi:hypothetical protein